MTKTTAIIGAGLVGICSAIALQQTGHQVTIFDKGAPGAETSRWNAGVLATSSLIPANNPTLFAKLPALMSGRHPGFRMNLRVAAETLPWALRFLSNARAAQCNRNIDALKSLIAHSRGCHEKLCKSASVRILDDRGWLMIFRGTQGLPRAAAQEAVLRRHGVDAHVLDAAALQDCEPVLKPVFSGAVHIADSAFTIPIKMIEHYVNLSNGLGIAIEAHHAAKVERLGDRYVVIGRDGYNRAFDNVVVAAGAWSDTVLRPLGVKLPMMVERGYLQSFRVDPEGPPYRPFLDVDAGYVAAPRDGRVQISSGTELTTLRARPNPAQLKRVVARARDAIELGAPDHSEIAVGNRPTLPDSLPVIGPVAEHPGLWLAFGHQHIGLSTSAGTGDLLSAIMNDQSPAIDMQPFAPARFGV